MAAHNGWLVVTHTLSFSDAFKRCSQTGTPNKATIVFLGGGTDLSFTMSGHLSYVSQLSRDPRGKPKMENKLKP